MKAEFWKQRKKKSPRVGSPPLATCGVYILKTYGTGSISLMGIFEKENEGPILEEERVKDGVYRKG